MSERQWWVADPGGVSRFEMSDAEALTVLLPDVDWETLREAVDTEWGADDETFDLARRLLAVYDAAIDQEDTNGSH